MNTSLMNQALQPTPATLIAWLFVTGIMVSAKGYSKEKEKNPFTTIKEQAALIRGHQDQAESLVYDKDQLARAGREKDDEIERLRKENRSLRQRNKNLSFRINQLETIIKSHRL